MRISCTGCVDGSWLIEEPDPWQVNGVAADTGEVLAQKLAAALHGGGAHALRIAQLL